MTRDSEAHREVRNTLWIECYQIALRVGWIFKTETIIMPAVLDAVVDSGFLRGLLPVLNRIGQSVPPLVMAGVLGRRPLKKWWLVGTSLAMAICFAILAAAWGPLQARRPDLLAVLFLVIYAAFSSATGLSQLVLAALQGKLIAPGHRGRALVVSVTIGSVLAIAAALILLGPWLLQADGFPKIFAATAAFFTLAAVMPIMLDEPPDVAPPATSSMMMWSLADGEPAGETARPSGQETALTGRSARWRRRRRLAMRRRGRRVAIPAELARLGVVAACFAAVLMLFPHYQAFARDRLGSNAGSLLMWVCTQNAATGLASLVAGPVSDRRGTRVVLVWLVALSAMTPLVVTGLSLLGHETAVALFWMVYVPLGLTPITLKMLTNYALELAPSAGEQPRYVSIVGVALAAPFVLSPLVGWSVDRVGFRLMFLLGATVIAAGAVVALGLPEPRHRKH